MNFINEGIEHLLSITLLPKDNMESSELKKYSRDQTLSR